MWEDSLAEERPPILDLTYLESDGKESAPCAGSMVTAGTESLKIQKERRDNPKKYISRLCEGCWG